MKWASGMDIVEPVFSDVTISSTTPSLYYATEDRSLRNFRAHFEIPSLKSAPAPARRFVLDFDGDVVTSIDGICIDDSRTAEGWYSLDGRRLDRKPTRKGVYIHNGNKVIVK